MNFTIPKATKLIIHAYNLEMSYLYLDYFFEIIYFPVSCFNYVFDTLLNFSSSTLRQLNFNELNYTKN